MFIQQCPSATRVRPIWSAAAAAIAPAPVAPRRRLPVRTAAAVIAPAAVVPRRRLPVRSRSPRRPPLALDHRTVEAWLMCWRVVKKAVVDVVDLLKTGTCPRHVSHASRVFMKDSHASVFGVTLDIVKLHRTRLDEQISTVAIRASAQHIIPHRMLMMHHDIRSNTEVSCLQSSPPM